MIRRIWAVLIKELREHVRDKRSLYSAMIFPVFGPVVFAATMGVMASWSNAARPVHLAVSGAERAPNLVAFLRRYGVTVEKSSADDERRIEDGKLDAALEIPAEYPDDFTHGRPARLVLRFDRSNRKSDTPVSKVKRVLEGYARAIGAERLLVRGVSPTLARAFEVDEVDLATPEQLGVMVVAMVPMFLVLAGFVGGMNVAVDTSAGERERGSLEPLLVNPVERGGLVLGKWLGTVVVASAALGVALVGFVVAMGQVPLEDLGVKAHLDGAGAVAILWALLPLVLLASGLQLWIGTFARTIKEAQTYLSMLIFVPMIPGMVLMFSPLEGSTALSGVPILGQYLLINGVLRQDAGMIPRFLLAGIVALALTGLCLWGTTRMLCNERVVFGRTS